jgi:hypothetical protein
VRLSVHVQPRASRNEVAGVHGDALKVRVQAPPVEGAANEAVCSTLAKALGVPRRNVAVVSGHLGRDKVVAIAGVSVAAVRRLLLV